MFLPGIKDFETNPYIPTLNFGAVGEVVLLATLPAPPCTSLHLPAPPCTSLHLPAPPYTSLHLPAPPYTSLHIPAPPCISLLSVSETEASRNFFLLHFPYAIALSLHSPLTPSFPSLLTMSPSRPPPPQPPPWATSSLASSSLATPSPFTSALLFIRHPAYLTRL